MLTSQPTSRWQAGRLAPPARNLPTVKAAANAALLEVPDSSCTDEERSVTIPTGAAPELECDQARTIVAQVWSSLATPPSPVDRKRFAASASDWLDPHGLWSVAPDSPLQAVFARTSEQLIEELEQKPGTGPCTAAAELGRALEKWVASIRKEMTEARGAGRKQHVDARRRWEVASGTPFEDGVVSRRARELARVLGHGMGVLEREYGSALTPLVDATLNRDAPVKTSAEWGRVVLAAAVRAYVPQLDPHGAWAPLDEETSIYDLELDVAPPPRLWSEMTRTTLGVRIDAGARAPIKNGDVVVRVGSVPVGGLSVEQVNQLSIDDDAEPTRVALLRPGVASLTEVEVSPELVLLSPPPAAQPAGLRSREVSYGDGHVLVVQMRDVPDDLGERLRSTLFDRPRKQRPLGVLLDLRGNGGGSTDGALSTLGVFLPGAALFPMRRRDGAIEIDRAPKLPPELVWTGPVAALVDGDSASAAEMLAGALGAYDRGVIVGSKTYGKGCAQEYLDDDAGVGVMRITTLVFSLPDGSALQRVGVSPHILLGLPPATDAEENLAHAPTSWRGPDVRDPALIKAVPWPDNKGRVGRSDDETIYRALRALGTSRAASRSTVQ